jgi:hypothetical protein
MEEEKKESEPFFKKYTIEQGTQEYEKLEGKFEEAFSEIEKIQPIDFKKIYLILPEGSKLKKKLMLWGFNLAKQCNSKVHLIAKRTKPIEEEISNLSKAMNVEFEFVAGRIDNIMSEIEKERNIVVISREMAEGIEKEESDIPILIV